MAALRDHRAAALKGGRIAAPVFCTRTGQYLDKKNVLRAFKTIVKNVNAAEETRAGEAEPDLIPARLRFHDRRLTHASGLIAGGGSIKRVSGRLDHADVSITLRVYAHLMPETTRSSQPSPAPYSGERRVGSIASRPARVPKAARTSARSTVMRHMMPTGKLKQHPERPGVVAMIDPASAQPNEPSRPKLYPPQITTTDATPETTPPQRTRSSIGPMSQPVYPSMAMRAATTAFAPAAKISATAGQYTALAGVAVRAPGRGRAGSGVGPSAGASSGSRHSGQKASRTSGSAAPQ
ncbi:tyrosine-type recombinase/integrase [Gemmata sp.]|uniref:tyrosine-type recombinase/integrase n=1 Tax=Gemmata sp. TaxID=1914242 RepID=UPI003F71F0E6